MASERIQRRIELLLDEADQAVAISDWELVLDRAKNVLAFDPENQDAAHVGVSSLFPTGAVPHAH